MVGEYQTIELKYKEIPEDVTQEYIAAMKYHVDQGLLSVDEVSEIYYELVDYLRVKEGWDN